MRRSAGAGNDDLEAGGFGALGESEQPLRRAMRRDDALVAVDTERGERLGRMAHGSPVRLASHDDGDGGGHFLILVMNPKHRPDYRVGPGGGKMWQGSRNALSCLGESRQAFISRPQQGWP